MLQQIQLAPTPPGNFVVLPFWWNHFVQKAAGVKLL